MHLQKLFLNVKQGATPLWSLDLFIAVKTYKIIQNAYQEKQ